jgi:hypothetical protein
MLLLTVWFAVNWFFALGYLNADIGRYYLVPILAGAVLGGLGAGALLDWIRISSLDADQAGLRRRTSLRARGAPAGRPRPLRWSRQWC